MNSLPKPKRSPLDLAVNLGELSRELQEETCSLASPAEVPRLLEALEAQLSTLVQVCDQLQYWHATATPGVELRGDSTGSLEASDILEEAAQELRGVVNLLDIARAHSDGVRWNVSVSPADRRSMPSEFRRD